MKQLCEDEGEVLLLRLQSGCWGPQGPLHSLSGSLQMMSAASIALERVSVPRALVPSVHRVAALCGCDI